MVTLYHWYLICFKVFFSILQCVSTRSYYCYKDSDLEQTITKLWTTSFLGSSSRVGCLALTVDVEECDGFLYAIDRGLCTGIRIRQKPESFEEKISVLSDQNVMETTELYWILKNSRTTNRFQRNSAETALIRLYVKTGDYRQAQSSRIKVNIVLIGEKGKIERRLKDPANTRKPFQLGSNDTFMIRSKDIGEIIKVQIQAKGRGIGDSWYLDQILIEKKSMIGDKGFSIKVYLAELGEWVTKKTHIMNIFKGKMDTKTLRLRKLREYTEMD